MVFEITKQMTVSLQVDCNSAEEAAIWADKIVATLEDENGNFVPTNEFISFEAEALKSEMKIAVIAS